MPMVPADLADLIRSDMGFPIPVSRQLKAWATGVITHLQTSGLTSNIPGTVLGIAPPSPGPLTLGTAIDGTISGLIGNTMASLIVSEDTLDYPFATPELNNMCSGICQHIIAQGIVSFAIGTINGACTNTPITPGVFLGVGIDGTISGLSGPTMATLVASLVGYPFVSMPLIKMCTAIANYIMANATVSYSVVTGVCSIGGGPLLAGTATGGKIA